MNTWLNRRIFIVLTVIMLMLLAIDIPLTYRQWLAEELPISFIAFWAAEQTRGLLDEITGAWILIAVLTLWPLKGRKEQDA